MLILCVHTVQGGWAQVYLLLSVPFTLCLDSKMPLFLPGSKKKTKSSLVEKEDCEGLLHIWASPTHHTLPPTHAIGNWANFNNYVLWAISLDYSTESYSKTRN